MPNIPDEIIDKLVNVQSQIWQTTSTTVSEAANQAITFSSPLVTAARTADLYSELSAPMMVIQFAFSAQPENPQVILIPQETVVSLVEAIQGSSIDEIDENIVADLRGPLESIVQGICLAAGNVRNDMVVASGLSIRFQIFSFPQNLQRADRLVRTQVAVSGEEVHGSLIWLMDSDTAHLMLGMDPVEDDATPFPKIGLPGQVPTAQNRSTDDNRSLDLLLDVPLEVSVELGRVKMLVRDVLDLGNGSILEIDKSAGEPVDVLVNGRLMARGEVVVIEDNFGVRITEIVNPNERFGRPGEAA
ncbi:MAG TPA: flagellar motor switch protein FliN [Fimbriimonas sp.]|nr:flagellar motor switch protein FliN [Fimbriimonas sp.]